MHTVEEEMVKSFETVQHNTALTSALYTQENYILIFNVDVAPTFIVLEVRLTKHQHPYKNIL